MGGLGEVGVAGLKGTIAVTPLHPPVGTARGVPRVAALEHVVFVMKAGVVVRDDAAKH